ncbi:MAG TPA: LacI family DNA-binding transcriptional regulator [Cellulomonas sp.]
MAQRPTLRDVSEAVGVSVYTASRALAGKSGVAAETRDRVRQTAERLGYVRNGVAAGLRTRLSHAVGVLTASGRNQYYSMLVQAIDGALQPEGYFAVTNDAIKDGRHTPEREMASVRALLEQRPSAIVATYSLRDDSIAEIDRFGVPIVFVDSLPPAGHDDRPFIGTDNRQASRLVADHLGRLGHRRAWVVAFPDTWTTHGPRVDGFVQQAAGWGMATAVVDSENDPDSACRAVLRALDAAGPDGAPDALYTLNTLLLQGTFRALRERGLRVGQDLSLVGFDDFDWAPLLDPPLTVVDQDIEEIGNRAGRLTLELIHGSRPRDTRVELPAVLVERDSCRPRPV